MSEKILAVCYDFDKTLAPGNMQEQGLLQDLGYAAPEEFWEKTAALASAQNVEGNLAYMYLLTQVPGGITADMLRAYGASVELYPGVETWFDRINSYGAAHGVTVEHYVISSGLKEMIEGTAVGTEFKEIFASSYLYSSSGLAVWPALVVNYTNKTQFLFRISKGVPGINDLAVNDKMSEFRVPFKNMVYIGDSETDIPCMALINSHDGYSVGVYSSDCSRCEQMAADGRIKYYAKADYSEGSEMEKLLKSIIVNLQ